MASVLMILGFVVRARLSMDFLGMLFGFLGELLLMLGVWVFGGGESGGGVDVQKRGIGGICLVLCRDMDNFC